MEINTNPTDDNNNGNNIEKEESEIINENANNQMDIGNEKTNNIPNSVQSPKIEQIKDITEEMKLKQNEIKLFNKTIDSLLKEILEKPKMQYYESFRIRRSDNLISLENIDDFEVYLLFKKNITIYYQNYYSTKGYITLVDNEVKSSLHIEKFMEIYKIKTLIYENHKYSFPSFKNELFKCINNNKKIIFICPLDDLKFIYNDLLLDNVPNNIEFNQLSKYSNHYFEYSSESIHYIKTKEREEFFDNLQSFLELKNINIFKLTGPSHNGKSVTLLIYSRMYPNIIYFNLKYIMELYYKYNQDYLKVMIYELGRAILSDEQISKINNLFESSSFNGPWNIINYLVDLLINKKLIFIFDQFKEKTIDFNIYSMIEKKLTESSEYKLKIIICSSINDGMIKSEVIKTIKKFKGNLPLFNKANEKYYYYINNLLDINQLKSISENMKNNEYFKDFNYNPKYVYKLSNSNNCFETIKKIDSHIRDKIKENCKENNVTSEEILLYSSSNVGKELKYNDDLDV